MQLVTWRRGRERTSTHSGWAQTQLSAGATQETPGCVRLVVTWANCAGGFAPAALKNILVALCVLPTGRCRVGWILEGRGPRSDKKKKNTPNMFLSLARKRHEPSERDTVAICPLVNLLWSRSTGSERTCLLKCSVVFIVLLALVALSSCYQCKWLTMRFCSTAGTMSGGENSALVGVKAFKKVMLGFKSSTYGMWPVKGDIERCTAENNG